MPPLRIAYVIIDCDGRDGTAVAMAHVMHRMARRSHEVHLFADVASGADLSLVRWHRVKALRDPSVARFASFYRRCSAEMRRITGDARFDVVHSAGCNTRGANLYQIQNVQPAKRAALEWHGQFAGGGLLRSLARRAYYAVTSAAERRLYQPQKRDTFGARGNTIHFCPVSRGTAHELKRHFPLRDADITVIPNGVDLDRFHPRHRDGRGAELRRQLDLATGKPVLLFVGGEWRRKGLQHAIEALPHLRADGPLNDAVLLVVGRDAAADEFSRLANTLGVSDRVLFAGFSDRPEDYFAVADAFVFPTYYEAYSLATLEAAAAGLPVVAARVNGTDELIRTDTNGDGINGALVDRSGPAIAAALDELASRPGGLAEAGRAARRIVEQEHLWDRIADEFEALYGRLAAGDAHS